MSYSEPIAESSTTAALAEENQSLRPKPLKKLRVAVLMTEAFASHGGVQLVNRNIAKAIGEHSGFDGEFFSLNDAMGDERYLCGQPFHGFGGNRVSFVARVFSALLRGHYDVVLVTHRNLFPLAVAWKAVSNRPYVLFAHGIEIWEPQHGTYRKALHGAGMVLANSQFTQERVCLANDLPKESVKIIPLSLDALTTVASYTRRPDGAATLLTVGRAVRQDKGQDAVICAMPRILAAYPDTRYVVAGGGYDLSRLRELANSIGVNRNVEFRGYVSDEEKNELYRNATLFIMPSRGEGFGLVYLEAMQFGLPCIAGNGDGARQIVHNGLNGITVDPLNLDTVAGGVLRLLGDAELRESMGQAGHRLLETRHSFSHFAKALCESLEQAAAGGD